MLPLMGKMGRAMRELYSHIRMAAKRATCSYTQWKLFPQRHFSEQRLYLGDGLTGSYFLLLPQATLVPKFLPAVIPHALSYFLISCISILSPMR